MSHDHELLHNYYKFPICAHSKPIVDEYKQDTVRTRTLETGIEEQLNLKRVTSLEFT
jgi:hypothetical protein